MHVIAKHAIPVSAYEGGPHSIGGDGVGSEDRNRLMQQLANSRDVAARLGGEEFGVLCFGHLDEELLVQVAERILTLINKESLKHEKGILQFTGSFGLGLSSPADPDWRAIYSRAYSALYQAKAAGKDRVVFGTAAGSSATGRFRSLRLVTAN